MNTLEIKKIEKNYTIKNGNSNTNKYKNDKYF